MGWLSSRVITAKMMMQMIWKTKLKWDASAGAYGADMNNIMWFAVRKK